MLPIDLLSASAVSAADSETRKQTENRRVLLTKSTINKGSQIRTMSVNWRATRYICFAIAIGRVEGEMEAERANSA